MVRYSRFLVYSLVAAFVAGIFLPAAVSQEEEAPPLEVISGEIVSIDFEKSTMVVKHLKDPESQTFEEITLVVSDLTTVEKEYKVVSLKQLAVGDKVSVEYLTEGSDRNIAGYIWVTKE